MSWLDDIKQQVWASQAKTDPVSGLPLLSDRGSPSDNQAQVTRALWDDYKTNFAPYLTGGEIDGVRIDGMLNNLTTENPALVGETVGKAQQLVGKSFDVARQNRQVSMSRFGMAPDAQTQASTDRQSQLAKSAAMAGAANTTRMGLKQRDMELMTSGVPNVAGRAYGMKGD